MSIPVPMPQAWHFRRSAALHGERPWQAHRPASTGALRAGEKRELRTH